MSIQDPINIPTKNSFIALHDKDSITLQSAPKIAEPTDEDRLNSIALSLPPFSPSPDSAMEIVTETNSNASMSIPQPIIDQMDYVIPVTGPSVDVDFHDCPSDKESNIIKNKNKRKKDQSSASSVSKRQVLGEGDSRLLQGKTESVSFSADGGAASIVARGLLSTNASLYDNKSPGPFDVIIQKVNDKNSPGSSSIDPLAIGRLLYFSNKNDILELKKIGYSKINIRFKTWEAANNLTLNQILNDKGYSVYIPLYRTTRKGVIRSVPLDLSEEEILGGLESVVEVSSVQRLGRRGGGPFPPPLLHNQM